MRIGLQTISPYKGSNFNFTNGILQNAVKTLLNPQTTTQQKKVANSIAKHSIESQLASSIVKNIKVSGNLTEVNIQNALKSNVKIKSYVDSKQSIFLQQNKAGKSLAVAKEINQQVSGFRNIFTDQKSNTTQLIGKNSLMAGGHLLNSTTINSKTNGTLNQASNSSYLTSQQINTKTYNAGSLTGESQVNRKITQNQATEVEKDWQSESDRVIGSISDTDVKKEGNKVTTTIDKLTSDLVKGEQVINTATKTRTDTQVENLDKNGNLISQSASAQEVESQQARTIDSSRLTLGVQAYKAISQGGNTVVTNESSFQVIGKTVDQTHTDTTVESFNAAGDLVGQRSASSDVKSVTAEDREGKTVTKTASFVQDGAKVNQTAVKAEEAYGIETKVVSADQNGAGYAREIETDGSIKTKGDLQTVSGPDGQKTLTLDAAQVKKTETEDYTSYTNGQGRLINTQVKEEQVIGGKVEFDPQTANAGEVSKAQAGGAVIEVGTYTGIRSSFKLDNGVLEFDFTATRTVESEQSSFTGKVTEDGVSGDQSVQKKASEETIHLKGKVVSSVDAEGRRVLTVEATADKESLAAASVNNGESLQTEEASAEYSIKGSIAQSTKTAQVDGKTVITKDAEAQMEVNETSQKVSNAKGTAAANLAPDSFQAGIYASNGALKFNFGAFNLNISFFA